MVRRDDLYPSHVVLPSLLCSPRTSAAALGQTKEELRAYLSHYHVCYTFAGDEFVPDPEAPLIRVSPGSLTRTIDSSNGGIVAAQKAHARW